MGAGLVAAPLVEHRRPGARLGHRLGDVDEQLVERRRRAGAELLAGRDVDVEVGDRLGVQGALVLLGPLGRAEQAVLLAVPAGEHDRAVGPPALAHERAEPLAHLEHGRPAAEVVVGAVGPGVLMAAEHHELVGMLAPGDHGEGVVERRLAVVDVELHVDAGRPRADVVLEAQAALEAVGGGGAAERAQQRLGLAVGDRGRRGVREVLGLVGLQARRARAPRAGPGSAGRPGTPRGTGSSRAGCRRPGGRDRWGRPGP